MNKDVVIGILSVLLLASVGGIVYLSQKGPVIVGGETTKELCGALPLFRGTLQGGSEAPQTIARDICYFVFAHEKGDSAICTKISAPEFQGQCYSALAVKTSDSGLCASASTPQARDGCYGEVAYALRDALVCDKIQSPDTRDNCLSQYAGRVGDASVCPSIKSQQQRDNCYHNQAFRDPALCTKIIDVNIRQDCDRNVAGMLEQRR